MTRTLLYFILMLVCVGAVQAQPSPTRKGDQLDDYHGTKVPDAYRWLEDDNSAETKAWVQAENKVTDAYLSKIPFREGMRQRIEQLWNYEKYSAPTKKSGKYFYFYNNGLQNQSVLYLQSDKDAKANVLLDPNTLSADGTTSLTAFSPRKAGDLAVYGVSEAGSDWNKFYVLDVQTGQKRPDELKWLKFSSASWYKDGFYYTRFDAPKTGDELKGQNEGQKVYYHKLGEAQDQDALVFSDPANAKRYYGIDVTDDDHYLLLSVTEGASGSNALHYRDLTDNRMTAFRPLVAAFDHSFDVVGTSGDLLLVLTNHNAPHYKLIAIDPKKPEEANWKTLIAESKDDVLQGVTAAGKYLLVKTMKDVANRLYVHDYAGKRIKEIELPGLGTLGVSGDKDDDEAFFSFSSYTMPATIYRLDLAKMATSVYKQPKLNYKPEDFTTEQVFYKSKDGARIPMFITYKKGLKKDGQNPTLLYGYGGFNVNLNPRYSPANILLLENGGVYALANLRGGGEYGEEWHTAGMLDKKQNVFDDFIAAAEYLIAQKYTSPQRLAINGGSNGGLLVGAAMAQRPELFKVALPQVGVMDMLRFHKFTVGWGWVTEYGSSDDPQQFKTLYAYSPLHNLKPGVKYPATMVMTSDHDDRVVPAHSFKFAARLQEVYKGPEPQLIRIETQAGHGAGVPTAKLIELNADVFAFIFQAMGVTPPNVK